MKTGFMRNWFNPNSTEEEKFKVLGKNTGNLVFREALQRLFDPINIPYAYKDLVSQFDKIIITDLIWIKENVTFNYLEKMLDAYSADFIPMSIGLQSKNRDMNFHMAEETVRLLKKMQERAILGVRGEYTAEILQKYGIKNIQIIGCPSMYYWNNPKFKIKAQLPEKIKGCANFKSFSHILNQTDKNFLTYCAERDMRFIEQTGYFTEWNAQDKNYFNLIDGWMKRRAVLPYTLGEWCTALNGYNFSLGGRFHGNVVALWNGMKSLFIVSDSRTTELTDFFHLPTITFSEFDANKPLEYYYDKADYTNFNKHYPALFKAFRDFVKKNGLSFSEKATKLKFSNQQFGL